MTNRHVTLSTKQFVGLVLSVLSAAFSSTWYLSGRLATVETKVDILMTGKVLVESKQAVYPDATRVLIHYQRTSS